MIDENIERKEKLELIKEMRKELEYRILFRKEFLIQMEEINTSLRIMANQYKKDK